MQVIIVSAGEGFGPADCRVGPSDDHLILWFCVISGVTPVAKESHVCGHVLGEAVSVRIQLMLQKITVLPQSLFAFILFVTKCHLIYISLVFWNKPVVA